MRRTAGLLFVAGMRALLCSMAAQMMQARLRRSDPCPYHELFRLLVSCRLVDRGHPRVVRDSCQTLTYPPSSRLGGRLWLDHWDVTPADEL